MQIALYTLVPTKDKVQSVENQLPELRRFAAVHGWTIHKEYLKEESAGIGQRSQFKAVFADAHHRHFDMVLFWNIYRVNHEGAFPTLMYLNMLETHGVSYKSLIELLDSIMLFKDAIIAVLATTAKQALTRLSERTKTRLARAVAKRKTLSRPTMTSEVMSTLDRWKIWEHLLKDYVWY
ncbi:recombinase family protein [Hymenobacter canadensis]|uniref:Recombinase family protein n=1 Tax=Hymenobacter canadensis TaxID=2999067 RepID=A0ABY7LXR5_9BACT|nr:recombinase family protein [Hymenobacter canadensis]WBA44311.1 recombinase family protein [Hymenobacter canadensis]